MPVTTSPILDDRRLARLPARERQQLPRQTLRALDRLDDFHDRGQSCFVGAVILPQHLGVDQHHQQQVVEVMGDAAGHQADRLHLLGMLELLVQPSLLGHVADQHEKRGHLVPFARRHAHLTIPALLAARDFEVRHQPLLDRAAERFADQILLALPEQFERRVIDEPDHGGTVGDDHSVRDRSDEPLELMMLRLGALVAQRPMYAARQQLRQLVLADKFEGAKLLSLFAQAAAGVQAGQDDDGGFRRNRAHLRESLDARGVRQRQIEDDAVETVRSQGPRRLLQARYFLQREPIIGDRGERLIDQQGVAGIVFDKQQPMGEICHHRPMFSPDGPGPAAVI